MDYIPKIKAGCFYFSPSTKSTTKVGKYLLQVVCSGNMNFHTNLSEPYICLDLTRRPSFHEFQ